MKVEIIDSCGCVFCDLKIKPVFKEGDGKLVHLVQIGRRVVLVDCTNTRAPLKDKPNEPL